MTPDYGGFKKSGKDMGEDIKRGKFFYPLLFSFLILVAIFGGYRVITSVFQSDELSSVSGENSNIAIGNTAPVSQSIQNIKVDNSILSPYENVSRMNYLGLPHDIVSDGSIKISTSISNELEGFVSVSSDSKIVPVCSEDSIEAYRKVIRTDPKYPYSYFYLGYCEELAGFPVSTWQETMKPAYEITKITTQIPNHDPTQNNILKYLKTIYEQ